MLPQPAAPAHRVVGVHARHGLAPGAVQALQGAQVDDVEVVLQTNEWQEISSMACKKVKGQALRCRAVSRAPVDQMHLAG